MWLYKSPNVINPYIPVKLQHKDGVQGVRNILLLVLILKNLQGHISKDWVSLATKLVLDAVIRNIVELFV